MSSTAFASTSLQELVAPLGSAGGKMERIRLAARRLGWQYNRTKDVWYADPRVRMRPEEIRDIEQLTGIRYGRDEIREIDTFIAKADAIMASSGKGGRRPFLTALCAFMGIEDRA